MRNKGFPLGAFTALAHNGRLIREAEEILQEAVRNDNAYIYIENPDGTTIKLQRGFKIKDYEYVIMKSK